MMMDGNGTIAAICTGVGGAISIIRLSGSESLEALKSVFRAKIDPEEAPRQLIYGRLKTAKGADGEGVLAVYMPNPQSYTGEDVAEIHCHGGMLNTKRLLEKILEHPCVRQAEPGEFSLRAFVNGKIDLTQAEATADLILAHSEMARQTAEHQLAGSLREAVSAVRDTLCDVLAECESRLDFPEDVPDLEEPGLLAEKLEKALSRLRELSATNREGLLFREGVKVAIAGNPNAGKSSLLNLILGYSRAIVSAIPGTTRDTLEESAHIRGVPVRMIDTAGIRETADPIEKLGVERSESTLREAAVIFWLLDPTSDPSESVGALLRRLADPVLSERIIPVWNKSDRIPPERKLPFDALRISALESTGIEALFDRFEEKVWLYPHDSAPEIAVNARQEAALEQAVSELEPLPEAFKRSCADGIFELAAIPLRDSIDALGEITGETASPDLLETIFSRFCIGK